MTKNEFERLQPGQMIQSKKDNKWVFIVHQNFGERLTAVRTIEVRDPENWEVFAYPPLLQVETTIEKSAHELHELFKGYPWYQTVGISDKSLVVYTSKKKHPKPHNDFQGWPVRYQYVGKIVPA